MCVDDVIILERAGEERFEGVLLGEVVKRDGADVQEGVFVFLDVYLAHIHSQVIFYRQG
jgi:hypothetical protein